MQYLDDEPVREADRVLVEIYRLLPPYHFGDALLQLAREWYEGTRPGRGASHTRTAP